ncbi:MAG: DNA ligase [Promethearchaeota archaeon]
MPKKNEKPPEPLNDLEDGESIEITSTSGRIYKIKNVGGVYSCNCAAWRFQNLPIEQRSCKHIRQFRGEEAEKYRVGNVTITRITTKNGEILKKEKEIGDKKWEPKVLLAQKWSEGIDPTGWYISEKLDGVRAYWDGKELWSRQGNKYYAPDWFLEGLPDFVLDGELFGGRGEFQVTVSIVRRQDYNNLWKDIKYLIFDAPDDVNIFKKRLEKINNWCNSHKVPYVEVLEQTLCKNLKHLKEELHKILSAGGEGLMIRQAGSKYVHGRSNTLLKVKATYDAEAKIIGYNPGKGKYKGMVGSLKCQMPNGLEFNLSGFPDEMRENPPPIGTIVTYHYQEWTKDGKPRFPAFFRIRQDVNWEEVIEAGTDSITNETIKKVKKTKNAKNLKKIEETKEMGKAKKTSKVKKTVKETTKKETASGLETESGKTYYYEFTDEKSNKFWQIIVSGNSFTTTYGRIGTKGSSTTKDWKDNAEAIKKAVSQRKSKENKGYTLKKVE